MSAINKLLRPKVADQGAGNIWFYDAKLGNQSMADCKVTGFFNAIENRNFRDGDLIIIDATDGNGIFSIDPQNNIVNAGGTQFTTELPLRLEENVLSIDNSSTTSKGAVILQDDIADVSSSNKATTPNYVRKIIDNSLVNPNNLADVDYGCLTNIALTGSVTYQDIIIPTGKRVAALNQTDATTNGIYISNDAGVWSRAPDTDTTVKLYLAQFTTLNADQGRFLCTIPKNSVMPIPITFIQLYKIDASDVWTYNPAKIYNAGALVVNPSETEFIFKCLVDGTVNVAPDMSSPNWEIYQGLLHENSATISPNGNDDKSVGFPYLTFTGAIVDLPINSYIEGRSISNVETITPKEGMKLRGNKVAVKNISVGVHNVHVDGISFIENSSTTPISVAGVNNSNFSHCKVVKNTSVYAIELSGLWVGIHKFSDIITNGDINITQGGIGGVVLLENILDTISVRVDLNVGAKLYLSNCPNVTINKINPNSSVTILNTDSWVGDRKLSDRTADHGSWLLCDGRAMSRMTYSLLFSVIGTTYGVGDGSSTFNLPDTVGKTVQISSGTYPSGTNTGNTSYTLTSNNLPLHTHSIDHSHASSTSGAGTAHAHTLSHTHSIDHSHSIVPVTGAAQQYVVTTNPAAGQFATPYVRDSNGSMYGDGQYDELRFYSTGGSTFVQPSDMDWLVIGTVSQSVNIPSYVGSSGLASNNITSADGSHTHVISVPSFTGTSGNNVSAITPLSLFQPTQAMGNMFICFKGNF